MRTHHYEASGEPEGTRNRRRRRLPQLAGVGVAVLIATLLPAHPASAVTGDITTVAGKGDCTPDLVTGQCDQYGGDGGPATSALLNRPQSPGVDSGGNIYFADSDNHRIRKFTVGGNISTVAGTGTGGFSGDGGAASSAQLKSPQVVAVDTTTSPNNLVIADTLNHRVRYVNLSTTAAVTAYGVSVPAGNITTIAGTGAAGFRSGEGSPATGSPRNVEDVVLVSGSNKAISLDGHFNADDPNVPNDEHDIGAVISGPGILPDTKIVSVDSIGTETTAVLSKSIGPAVSPTTVTVTPAVLHLPYGLAVDSTGDLYIADVGNRRVRKVQRSGAGAGTITTVAGNGTAGSCGTGTAPVSATSAQLNVPIGVALNGSDLYITDQATSRVCKVAGGTITTVAGTTSGFSGDGFAATAAQLRNPFATAVVTSGTTVNLYIADAGNHRIRKAVVGGTISTVAGTGAAGSSGDGGAATAATLNNPRGVAAGGGNLYIADTANHRIRKVEGLP